MRGPRTRSQTTQKKLQQNQSLESRALHVFLTHLHPSARPRLGSVAGAALRRLQLTSKGLRRNTANHMRYIEKATAALRMLLEEDKQTLDVYPEEFCKLARRRYLPFIHAGADPNVKVFLNGEETTMLHLAASNSRRVSCGTSIMKQLLDSGANPNARDSYGDTPLVLVARAHTIPAMRLLLRSGANVNVRSRFSGYTPLLHALLAPWTERLPLVTRLETLRTLLKSGADPNAGAETMANPLEVALWLEQPAVAALLVEYGADPTKLSHNLKKKYMAIRRQINISQIQRNMGR